MVTFAAGEFGDGGDSTYISDGNPITVKKEEYEANTYKNKTLSLGDPDVKVFEIAYYKLLEKNFLPLKDGGISESAYRLLGKNNVEKTMSFSWTYSYQLKRRSKKLYTYYKDDGTIIAPWYYIY